LLLPAARFMPMTPPADCIRGTPPAGLSLENRQLK
jgi:hypothetical protein